MAEAIVDPRFPHVLIVTDASFGRLADDHRPRLRDLLYGELAGVVGRGTHDFWVTYRIPNSNDTPNHDHEDNGLRPRPMRGILLMEVPADSTPASMANHTHVLFEETGHHWACRTTSASVTPPAARWGCSANASSSTACSTAPRSSTRRSSPVAAATGPRTWKATPPRSTRSTGPPVARSTVRPAGTRSIRRRGRSRRLRIVGGPGPRRSTSRRPSTISTSC